MADITRKAGEITRRKFGEKSCGWMRSFQMSQTILQDIPEIDGVEQCATAPSGAKAVAGPFWTDQITLLVQTARTLRDRSRGLLCIAPEGGGFTIFRKMEVKG